LRDCSTRTSSPRRTSARASCAAFVGAFQRHQREEWRKATAEERGGGQALVSIDGDDSEAAFQAEDTSVLSPEVAFEKQCALALLAEAMTRLASEQNAAGKGRALNCCVTCSVQMEPPMKSPRINISPVPWA